MNTPYSITCALLFFGVGRSPFFSCAASLNTEWESSSFFCTVMILQIWLCWLLWTAVPDEHLICWRSESLYTTVQWTCVVALSGFIQKSPPPIGKPAACMNDRVGGENGGLKSLCVLVCVCALGHSQRASSLQIYLYSCLRGRTPSLWAILRSSLSLSQVLWWVHPVVEMSGKRTAGAASGSINSDAV